MLLIIKCLKHFNRTSIYNALSIVDIKERILQLDNICNKYYVSLIAIPFRTPRSIQLIIDNYQLLGETLRERRIAKPKAEAEIGYAVSSQSLLGSKKQKGRVLYSTLDSIQRLACDVRPAQGSVSLSLPLFFSPAPPAKSTQKRDRFPDLLLALYD